MTYQQQSPYPQQYPSYGYGPPQRPGNGVATGGFVTALVGAVIALIPILGIVSWVISPIGLVLSIVGLAAAWKRGGTGKGLAIAGIALGAAGLLICVLYAAAFSAAFQQGFDNGTSGTSYSVPSYGSPAPRSATQGPAGTASADLPEGTFEQGTYVVGEDIRPGRYRTDGAPEGSIFPFCMASRQDADGGPIGFPETTNEGPALLTVQAADAQVEFSGDCTWSRR